MLLMVEKGIRVGTCHTITWYVKAINKCMKDYNKNKESSYLRCWDINNLYGWRMLLNLLVADFILARNSSKFNKNLIKTIMNIVTYFLAVDVQHPEKSHEISWEEWKLEGLKDFCS